MESITLNNVDSKIIYNWFFHAFSKPTYHDNELCSKEDIIIMKKLEKYLLENENE